jgi:hypothetical protein
VWLFAIGPVVDLPCTLPQDHTLLTLLGHRSPELWLEQASAIEREHGLIHCDSHPDPGCLGDVDKRAIYAAFLDGLAERDASGGRSFAKRHRGGDAGQSPTLRPPVCRSGLLASGGVGNLAELSPPVSVSDRDGHD